MSGVFYNTLVVHTTTMPEVTRSVGSTATPSMLRGLFGPNWVQTLLQYQVAGGSCVYYIDSDTPRTSAFQLCFDKADALVAKTKIDASASSAG